MFVPPPMVPIQTQAIKLQQHQTSNNVRTFEFMGRRFQNNQSNDPSLFYQLKQYTTIFDDLLVNVLSYVWSVAAKQQKLFKVLLDTGKSTSLIREGIIPKKDVRKRSQDD